MTQSIKTEAMFNDWMAALRKTDQLSEESKAALAGYIENNRHVLIVDVRKFFVDALPPGDKRSNDYPIGLLSRALPLVLLDSYSDVGDAVGFCKAAGFTYELHVYNERFFQTVKQ